MKYRTKKDIVIPAGTVLECVDGNKREFVSGNYEVIIGLTDDTSGHFTYGVDTGDPKISEWFEEVK